MACDFRSVSCFAKTWVGFELTSTLGVVVVVVVVNSYSFGYCARVSSVNKTVDSDLTSSGFVQFNSIRFDSIRSDLGPSNVRLCLIKLAPIAICVVIWEPASGWRAQSRAPRPQIARCDNTRRPLLASARLSVRIRAHLVIRAYKISGSYLGR